MSKLSSESRNALFLPRFVNLSFCEISVHQHTTIAACFFEITETDFCSHQDNGLLTECKDSVPVYLLPC